MSILHETMSNVNFSLFKRISLRWSGSVISNYPYAAVRQNHYDIAIAGGGLVGTSMACALAKNSKLSEKKIILLESSKQKNIPKKSAGNEYSNRVVSLNPGSMKFLESLGAWKHISDVRYKVVKKLQVWDACSDALITFNDDLINDVSYIVENNLILESLEKICLEQKNNITVKYESKIKNIELPIKNKSVELEMENGDKYSCDLLIGADGANSKTRHVLGCQYLSWNYHQKGIVATLKLSEPMENIVAWQRFLPTGPIALLPLTEELCSLVWSADTSMADELLKLSDEAFVDGINDAFWKIYPTHELVSSVTNCVNNLLQNLTLKSNGVRQLPPTISSVMPKSRAAFPLGFGHSTKYVGSGVALVGDAAHRIHPLAGQGVNLGFGDVELLTEKLAESVYSGNKIGSWKALAEYESERQKQIVPMLTVVDLLQRLYTTSYTPVVLLRSVGLQVTNALNPLKRLIIDRASV